MKISELQAKLARVLEESGDLEVTVLTDTPDGLFCFSDDPAVDVISRPVDEYRQTEETLLAIGWKECLGDPNE